MMAILVYSGGNKQIERLFLLNPNEWLVFFVAVHN